jgi:hypothetical protein
MQDDLYGIKAEGTSGPHIIHGTSFSGNFMGAHVTGSVRVRLEGVTIQDSRNQKSASGLYVAENAFVQLVEGSLVERTVLSVQIAGSGTFAMGSSTIRHTVGSAVIVSCQRRLKRDPLTTVEKGPTSGHSCWIITSFG